MKTIKRRFMSRDVITAPHEPGAERTLNTFEYNRLCGYGTLCWPNQDDLALHPEARVIVFFDTNEQYYIIASDQDGNLYPSCKALFGGFIRMRNGSNLFFGPGMSAPMVPESMLTRDGQENICREMDLVTWEPVTAIENKLIEAYDAGQAEIDDKAMVARRTSKTHFEQGNRSQYLTPSLMPDEFKDVLVEGTFCGFLQMTNRKLPHAMVFEVSHPSGAPEMKRRMIVPLNGCRFEEEDDPSICQEAEMELPLHDQEPKIELISE